MSSSPSPLSAPLLPVSEDSDGNGGEKDHGHGRASFAYAAALFSVSAVSFLAGNLSAGGNHHVAAWKSSSSSSPAEATATGTTKTRIPANLTPAEAERLFDETNARLVSVSSPPRGARDDDNEAEEEGYALSDVVLSSALADAYHALHPNMLYRSWEKASEAREACKEGQNGSGSEERRWPCLEPIDDEEIKKNEDKKKEDVIKHANGHHPLPKHQSQPSEHTVAALRDMIRSESVGSIAEFGAGAGQLKAAVLNGVPSLTDDLTEYLDHAKAASALGLGGEDVPEPLRYDAYDAAGNVASWTDDFVTHFDPKVPLSLPKSDWVVSLGYGSAGSERPLQPSSGEGMLVRNLHRHNCRGIILDSRAAVTQAARPHSREPVKDVFETLGYKYDADMSDKFFDVRGNDGGIIMVFRRREPVC